MRTSANRNPRKARFWLAGIFVLLVSAGHAQPDDSYNFNPGRPGFSYGSTPLIRHTISAEAFVCETWVPGFGSLLTNRYMFRYSPLDRLELGVGVGLGTLLDTEGSYGVFLSPVSVMAKINLIEKTGNLPGLAFIGELGLPGGDIADASPGVTPSAILALDHNYRRWGFFYNVGAAWDAAEGTISLFYSFMASVQVDKKGRWSLYGELVGKNGWCTSTWSDDPYAYDYGSVCLRLGGDVFITRNLKMDFSVASSFDFALQGEIGFSYGIPLKRRARPKE